MQKLSQFLAHLQRRLRKCFLLMLCLLLAINLFCCYGYFNYPHISRDAIHTVLFKEVIPTELKKDRPDCTYEGILQSTHSIHTWDITQNYDDFDAAGVVDGSFSPGHCNPLFSVAILVTYRNRQKQLDIFLPYMHNFLRKQNIHYKIYLIEQQDEKPWNKGLLYNIGARQAIADGFPCLILHDVDLLPLDDANLYACTAQPRHFSASIDKHRFVLPYKWLVGGVLAIRSEQYKELNGLSNRFLMWGGEDDDFYMRMVEHDIQIIRFPREMSRYTMLRHAPEPMNPARWALLRGNRRESPDARASDGMRALAAAARVSLRNHRLFTLVAVET